MPEPLDPNNLEVPDLGLNNQTDNTQPPEQHDQNEFINQYLTKIPDHDRQIVQKYANEWDKSVTQKFQDYSSRLRPYEELGTVDELMEQIQWINAMNQDPVKFLNDYTELLRQEGLLEAMAEEQGQQQEQETSVLPEWEGVPKAFVDEFTDLKSKFSEISQRDQQRAEQEEFAASQKQLDDYLSSMHNTYGDFDNDYIVAQLAQGIDPDRAVENFKEMTKKYGTQKGPSAPNVLLGSGSTPKEQAPNFRDKSTRTAWMLQALEQAQG